MTSIPNTCEFCGERIIMMVLTDHPRSPASMERSSDVYVACPNCLLGLVTLSLAPWQFKRARNAGVYQRYYLHADFYDHDTGEALQPKLEGLTHREEPT